MRLSVLLGTYQDSRLETAFPESTLLRMNGDITTSSILVYAASPRKGLP